MPLPAISLALCGLVCALAFRSLYLALEFHRSLPWGDQWVFIVNAYFPYLDGIYNWSNISGFHNEHRIGTARLVLFADAIFFNMNGWLPLVAQYLSLAGVAVLLARLAAVGRSEFVIVALTCLGFLWSTTQFENFSNSLQVAFPLVHLFAVGALMALAYSLTERRSVLWLFAAIVLDVLAVNSLASGILIVVPALCISIWLRRLDWRIVAFTLVHAALVWWYFSGFKFGHHVVPNGDRAVALIVGFLAVPFRAHSIQNAIALLGIVTLLVACAAMSWVAVVRLKPADRGSAVLLAVAIFVFGEAILTSLGRGSSGIHSRYSTPSLVFYAALIGFYYRQCTLLPERRMAAPARSGIAVIAALAVVSVNSRIWTIAWSDRAAALDRSSAAILRGVKAEPGIMGGVTPQSLDRLVSLRLGVFAHVR